jgi:3'(2'), 5'-bisphosphate nucleotidase
MDYNNLLKQALNAAILAGKEILTIYDTNFFVETKSDNSPVTIADKAASKIIVAELANTNIVVLSEEEELIEYENRKNLEYLWIVDPLDGTKEFVKRNGEFTVNIALIENKTPVIGVIYSPVFKDVYFACKGMGSFKVDKHSVLSILNTTHSLTIAEQLIKQAIPLPSQPLPSKYTVVASRSHLSTDLHNHIKNLEYTHAKVETINVGSSIKLCWVAEGKAHEYPRYGNTMEWDTAAGQCIVEMAGGKLIDLTTTQTLVYNRKNLTNNSFVAFHHKE